MAKKPVRDLTREEQLARGPMDLPFLMLVLILFGVGLIMLLSASSAAARYDHAAGYNPTYYFRRQLLFGAAGVACMYVASKINYQTLRWMSIFILIASYVFLFLVFTPLGYGRETVGAQRWIQLGPINFQPSEVAKVGVVLYFSARLSKRREGPHQFKHRLVQPLEGIRGFLDRIGLLELIPYALILLSIAVLMLKQPHMSGTILILAAGAAVLFAAGVKMYWFLGGGAFAVVALNFIIHNTDYMTKRMNIWENPWSEPAEGGYQIIQSLYAIASGGLSGLGLGKSRQKYLYLPEEHNDFVFAVVCEELGYIGAALVLVLFALLILRGYWLALHARDRFGSLVVVGIITLLAVQVFLNIAVVTNLLPTTGISLPFFSYGGTALMIQLAEMGIVLSVSRQIPAPKQG